MRELHVVGLTPDGQHLLLAGSADAAKPSHRVAVDARFEAALRGVRPEDPASVPALSPRDIQARLRAGETVEQVATQAGLPVSRVQRFAGPVLSERENLLHKVYLAHQIGRRGTSSVPLEHAVAAALAEMSFVRPETIAWTAYRRGDGGWVAKVAATIRGRVRTAEWSLAADGKTVRPLDPWASSLGHVEAAQPERTPVKRPSAAKAAPPKPPAAKAVPPKPPAAKAVPPKPPAAKAVPPKPPAAKPVPPKVRNRSAPASPTRKPSR